MTTSTTLVVGASGATGKWVVKMLLDQEKDVKVVVRSKQRMLDLLKEINDGIENEEYAKRLTVTEASLLDLTDEELKELVGDCQSVVSCLGHNMDFKGLFGHPRKLVTDATRRLCSAMDDGTSNNNKKFILMGSEGVANPNGGDDERGFAEKSVLFALRNLIPPHADNESAAAYLCESIGNKPQSGMEWCVVRPTDLIDSTPSKYVLFKKPQGSLFGSGNVASRSNVAKLMVDLIVDENKWNEWKYQMPVIHDEEKKPDVATEETK